MVIFGSFRLPAGFAQLLFFGGTTVEACEAVSDGMRCLTCGWPAGSKAVYVGVLAATPAPLSGVLLATLARALRMEMELTQRWTLCESSPSGSQRHQRDLELRDHDRERRRSWFGLQQMKPYPSRMLQFLFTLSDFSSERNVITTWVTIVVAIVIIITALTSF